MKISYFKQVFAVSCALVTSGCANIVETKTIVSNSNEYMAENFTPMQLAQPIRDVLNRGETYPKLFSKIDFTTTVETEDDKKISTITGKGTYTSLGNGYIQSRIEFAKNDVPYRINLDLLYAGIQTLKFQSAYTNLKNAQNSYEVKEIVQFDRGVAKPKEGQSYVYFTKLGIQTQLSNLIEYRETCVAGNAIEASTLHASLTGQAIPLECTRTGTSGLVTGKNKYLWVEKVGVAFLTESTSSSAISRYKFNTFSITG